MIGSIKYENKGFNNGIKATESADQCSSSTCNARVNWLCVDYQSGRTCTYLTSTGCECRGGSDGTCVANALWPIGGHPGCERCGYGSWSPAGGEFATGPCKYSGS